MSVSYSDVPQCPTQQQHASFVELLFENGSIDYNRICLAEELVTQVFAGVTRDTGDKYVVHLRRTAIRTIIGQLHNGESDSNQIIIALLHDLVEDFPYQGWFWRIWGQFRFDVAMGVWWCSKPKKIWCFGSKRVRNWLFHRKLWLAPKRYIVVKIHDRIDNLNDMWPEHHDVEYQLQKIKETIKVYLALAHHHDVCYGPLSRSLVEARQKARALTHTNI